jgi:hypothetical protein
MTERDQKEVMKQAIKEWMDERYADIGRWTVKTAIVGGLASLLLWYISMRGFKFP